MGTTIHHCGGVGTGMRTKLVNNYLAIISCQLNAEAIALSQRFGLSLKKTLDVHPRHDRDERPARDRLASEGPEGRHSSQGSRSISRTRILTLIVNAANAANVPMPVAAVAREAFSVARSRGYGAKDFSSIVDVLCDIAGIEKPRLNS